MIQKLFKKFNATLYKSFAKFVDLTNNESNHDEINENKYIEFSKSDEFFDDCDEHALSK